MKTRQELIDDGKVWTVCPDNEPENILFEGNKTSCIKYLRENNLFRQYKKGLIRLGKVIWEKEI